MDEREQTSSALADRVSAGLRNQRVLSVWSLANKCASPRAFFSDRTGTIASLECIAAVLGASTRRIL